MAFEKIRPVPDAQTIIDRAFKISNKKKIRKKKGDQAVVSARKQTREKITLLSTYLIGELKNIPSRFPSTDELNDFYRELISLDFSLETYKKNLGRISSTTKTIRSITTNIKGKVLSASTEKEVISVMHAYIGRLTSAINKLDKTLKWLEDVRKKMLKYPVIKDQFTVCIAGFPNVGKTTLFSKITSSSAEIKAYAFTTKRLNVGYIKTGYRTIQVIDTPGTLNRSHMNDIEKQADLALKYVADLIVYVFDPTLQYPKEEQASLRKVMDGYNAKVIDFCSKKDIVTKKQIDNIAGNAITSAKKIKEIIIGHYSN